MGIGKQEIAALGETLGKAVSSTAFILKRFLELGQYKLQARKEKEAQNLLNVNAIEAEQRQTSSTSSEIRQNKKFSSGQSPRP